MNGRLSNTNLNSITNLIILISMALIGFSHLNFINQEWGGLFLTAIIALFSRIILWWLSKKYLRLNKRENDIMLSIILIIFSVVFILIALRLVYTDINSLGFSTYNSDTGQEGYILYSSLSILAAIISFGMSVTSMRELSGSNQDFEQ